MIHLRFDDAEAAFREFYIEISQGSPLSPILFILYIASLYKEFEEEGITVIGFADDTNLIVYNNDIATNCECLEHIWAACERWAVIRRMAFVLKKSELIHFIQTHILPKQMIQFSDTNMAPVESARFFGVWLDRKLRWHQHLKIMQAKLSKQQYALIKLTVSM